MLNGIHLVNFGNHRSTRLITGSITVLVGQNGSGKTTAMRGITQIDRATRGHRIGYNREYIRKGSEGIILTASWRTTENEISYDWGVHVNSGVDWMRRRPLSQSEPPWIPDPSPREEDKPPRSSRVIDLWDEAELAESPAGTIEWWARHSLDWSSRYFKTNARHLQSPSYSEDEAPHLGEDGSNFAWTLAYLMTAEPDRFARIMAAFRTVIPIVRRVRARPVQIAKLEKKSIVINKQERSFDEPQPVMGQELIFDMISGESLPASAISEGTLLTLALLTVVHGGEDVDFVMLDDVELGLHPRAQRDLVQQLRQLQQSNRRLQILVSTHSPYIVDEFAPEDVWLFAVDTQGCTVSKRLSDHPDAKRALEVLTTGEFWSAEGETWIKQTDRDPARKRTVRAKGRVM